MNKTVNVMNKTYFPNDMTYTKKLKLKRIKADLKAELKDIPGYDETKKRLRQLEHPKSFSSPQNISKQEDLNSKVANLVAFTYEKKEGSNGNFWRLHLENDT